MIAKLKIHDEDYHYEFNEMNEIFVLDNMLYEYNRK